MTGPSAGREPPAATRPRRVTILGATGSVGSSTLALIVLVAGDRGGGGAAAP